MKTENSYASYSPQSPGDVIEEILQRKGWSQRDLAIVLDRPVQAVNEIIAGKKAITPETAVALSAAFGTSASYWLQLEGLYRIDILRSRASRTRESSVERRAKLFSKVPVNELIKRGWINADLSDLDQTESAVCGFLGIKSLDEEPDGFLARKTIVGENTAAQTAWACRARNLAKKIKSGRYSKDGLFSLIGELPSWSQSEEETRKLPTALASVGVRLVFVEHLNGTRIDGGATRLGATPVVALSLRYDRVDWFWFTLMHELAHVIEHEESLDVQLVGNDAQEQGSGMEEHANQQAAGWLIPQERLQTFVRRVRPYFSRSAILDFAGRCAVHPGIVVGQLQKRGEIPYSHHRNLLVRVRHVFADLMV
jgi:HTH-type transcriptional regulator / antitoxin HigA